MGLRFLALACLVGAALAGPVQKPSVNKCATQCDPPHNPKFKFQPGKVYTYHATIRNEITYFESRKQSATIKADLEFNVQSPCEGVLNMKNIRIDQKLSQVEKDDLMKKLELPLPYVWRDGQIEHVCASSEESTQSLNIKRALLSTLVNTMKDLRKNQNLIIERDGMGHCKTNYTSENSRGEILITKVKDLKTCTERKTSLIFMNKELSSSLIMAQDHLECKQHVVDGIIVKTESHERQVMKNPLKAKESLIKLNGNILLEHKETKPGYEQSIQEPVNRAEILYTVSEPRDGDSNVKEAERLLQHMCQENKPTISIAVSKDFLKLIALVKHLSYRDLNKIYESLKNGQLCDSKKVRDIYFDTLPIAQTTAAVKLMVKVLLNGDTTLLNNKVWPASFALIQNSTEETVAAVVPLLKKHPQCTATSIGIASLVHRLCSSEDCSQMESVAEIVNIYKKELGPQCSNDDDNQVYRALRAFGNMGFHGVAHETIMACAKSDAKPIRIRLAAVDSFRRMHSKRPQELLDIYANKNENHEVRIQVFKACAPHADVKQLKQIKQIAESETNEQVSGFVNTYMRNMNKNVSPRHQNLKSLLQKVKITPPKVDYLTNSKSIQVSTYNDEIHAGASLEANIIHAETTKIPTASDVRMDLDIFGKSWNVLEWGVRTEGLEQILQNLIEMKNKVPKYEEMRDRIEKAQSLEDLQSEFEYLSPRKILKDVRPELSMYFRTLNTEILGLSSNDLSGVKEMLKIADLMTKLAHGQNAEFSHSFVFMDSKLVVPSVTGRCYSIDVAGTSTVGVTAKAKADILNLPRNAEAELHFSPSATVEISTTVGIQSNTHRRDVRAVVRAQGEFNVRTDLSVKEGSKVVARMSFPSENVARAKISTDLYEIDEDHKEKRIFEKMEKKIDYCTKWLEKPAGMKLCGSLEVPKSNMLETFPYIRLPFGNAQVSLKKTDTFRDIEIRAEIPKQQSPRMKFRVSIDTPGSKVPRLFAADLELKKQRDQKDIKLQLTSPFKSVRARGSITSNDNLIKGSLVLDSEGAHIVSANITSQMTASRSRKNYELSGEYSLLNYEPARIEGTVTVTKGRKLHVSYDIKTNAPEERPFNCKGTLMKEGRFDVSPKGEWKLSSDISCRTPLIELTARKTFEKRSKQAQMISANVAVDYQCKGHKKETVTIAVTSQKSSNKRNTNAKLELTKDPSKNLYLSWDSQRESENSKNDIKLKYGQNPDNTYIQLTQKSKMPQSGQGHCSLTLDVPHRNLHHELNVVHEINMNRVNIEADLCYKQDKHMKVGLDVNFESKSPLKATGKLEVELKPHFHVIYEDEIEETEDNVLIGKSKLTYRKGKVIQLNYKIKKLSNNDKFHHEIESSIQTPLSRSPLNSKASILLNSESMAIEGHVGSDYSAHVHLKENGSNHINIKTPMFEGTLTSNVEGEATTIVLDGRTKMGRPQHIVGRAIVIMGDKKQFLLSVQPYADRNPDAKILLSTVLEMMTKDSKEIYKGSLRLKVFDLLDIYLTEKGEISILGDQEFTLEASVKNKAPVKLSFNRKTGHKQGKTTVAFSRNNVVKAEISLEAKQEQSHSKNEFSLEGSLTSQDHSFEDMSVKFSSLINRSGSSKTIQTFISLKKHNRVYHTELNSDLQPNGLEVKAEMQTPHANFEKNAVGFSVQVSESGVSSTFDIACSKNKKISIATSITSNRHSLSLTCKVKSPFEGAEDAKLQITLDNHRSKKSIEGHLEINDRKISLISEVKREGNVLSASTSISTPFKYLKDAKSQLSIEKHQSKRSILWFFDVNEERKADVELSAASSSQGIDVKGRIKTAGTPEMSVHVKYEKTGESFLITANVMKGTSPLFSSSFNTLSYPGGHKLLMKTKSLENTLIELEILKEAKDKHSSKYTLKAKGQFHPVHITFSRNQNDRNSVSAELRACREGRPSQVCYSLKSHRKSLIQEENFHFLEKISMNLEKSVGGSYSKPVGSFQMLVSATERDYRSKITLEVEDKKLGYDLKYHSRQDENDRCSLDTYIFSARQTSRVRVTLHHKEHHVHLEADAIPNTDEPTRKLSFEMKKEMHPENHEVTGYIKMNHPRMSQPLLLTCKMQPVGDRFVKAKFVLHSGAVWGKTLMMEVIPDLEKEAYGIRSMLLKMSCPEKSREASLKLIRQSSRREEKIGYEWRYISQHDDEKKGSLTVTLLDKTGVIPKTIKVAYSSPSADYEVQGSVAQGPQDISVSVASAGRKLNEILIKTSDSCMNIDVTNSDFKTQICIMKHEGRQYQLFKAVAYYHQHKCLNIQVGVDPEKPEYIDVVVKCSKEQACQELKEMIKQKLLRGRTVEGIQQDLLRKVNQLSQNVIRKVQQLRQDVIRKVKQVRRDVDPKLKKLLKSLQELMDDLPSKMKNKLKQHEKLINECHRKLQVVAEKIQRHIESVLPDSVKKVIQEQYPRYRREAIRYHQQVNEIVNTYWPKDWEFVKDYKNIEKQVEKKVKEIEQKVEKFRKDYPNNVLHFIKDGMKRIQQKITTVVDSYMGHGIASKIFKYVEKMHLVVRQKAMIAVDEVIKRFNKIYNLLSQDEDLRSAKEMVLNAKNEMIKAWNNKEQIAQSSVEQMERNIKYNFKNFADKNIQVLNYDPSEGEIKFRVRSPASKSNIEELKEFFRRLREYLSLRA